MQRTEQEVSEAYLFRDRRKQVKSHPLEIVKMVLGLELASLRPERRPGDHRRLNSDLRKRGQLEWTLRAPWRKSWTES